MKKLLIVLIFMISGCGYSPADIRKGIIVTQIKSYSGYCCYVGAGNKDLLIFGSPHFNIIDKCGKFNVGDTIKLVK